MLSKKYFWQRSEEEYFKNKPASRILIQATLISDFIIAHFCRSDAHRLTFSTASTRRRLRLSDGMALPGGLDYFLDMGATLNPLSVRIMLFACGYMLRHPQKGLAPHGS